MIHYFRGKLRPPSASTSCGLRDSASGNTTDHAKVTCRRCKRTIYYRMVAR